MITRSIDTFLAEFAKRPSSRPATARGAFLVAPAAFSLASESASDNRYMAMSEAPDAALAMQQHAHLAEALRADCPIIVFPGDPDSPDGVFPNNIFGTAPGAFIVGAMAHGVRQREAGRTDIRHFFTDVIGYHEVDLSVRAGTVAELTGSLIIDHARNIGYCGLGKRCNMAGAEAMHDAFGLDLTFCFDLAEGEYHTNVVMAMLAGKGVMLAADGFADPRVPQAIAKAYENRAIQLAPAQKEAFAGNAITLADDRVWISRRGADALPPEQTRQLHDWGFAIGSVDLSEIEKAGGSLRCCVAELF